MKILGLLKVSRGASLDRIYLLKLWGYGLFLHKIHASDPPGVWHSHPWNGFSIIFGSYLEEYQCNRGVFHPRRLYNRIFATLHHRVAVEKPVWTLFFHLPKCNSWSIIDSSGRSVDSPWEGAEGRKDYTKALNDE